MTDRRAFLKTLASSGLVLGSAGLSASAWADSKSRSTQTSASAAVPTNTGIRGRVVVVGGGMAGATVAKYLRLWGGTGVDVTLVERDAMYTSSIMSNLVLTGQRTINSLKFGYDQLISRYGVRIVKGDVISIDRGGKLVVLADNTRLPYDRLVIAPGIQFDTIPGLETASAQALVPHAWKAGEQTTALRNMITAMPSGGTFVMSIPAKPYRCPPGPYERACVVADWLKKNKPGSRVIVLDANPGITAEVHTFTTAFNFTHAGVIDYRPGVTVESVDTSSMTVNTSTGPKDAKVYGSVRGNVLNLIPAHRAGNVITANGLADADGRWTKVNVLSYEAIAAPGIHVIGDASATTQPKAGHIANQEAKVCADAITRLLAGRELDPSPVTNSACYSPITADTASWLTAVFNYDSTTKTMVANALASGEASAPSKDNYEDMTKWFNTLMADSFA